MSCTAYKRLKDVIKQYSKANKRRFYGNQIQCNQLNKGGLKNKKEKKRKAEVGQGITKKNKK